MGFNTKYFSENISKMIEFDYGDFMRSANVFLNQLREELSSLNDKNISQRLDLMQTYLQFSPNWDVEATRTRLLEDAGYIDELLKGHEQDWESVSSAV